jgi:hypothetical protein
LGLKELHNSHTKYYLRETVSEILEEYGIEIQNVFKIVSDNGSNFVAAFSDKEAITFSTSSLKRAN